MVMLDAIHYKMRKKAQWFARPYISTLAPIRTAGKMCRACGGCNGKCEILAGGFDGTEEPMVENIFIASVDGLSGFSESIAAVYHKIDVQRRIIRQIRSSTRYVSYKDVKAFTETLKPIYKAPTEGVALTSPDESESAWDNKYPAAIKSWRTHWDELSTMFKHPDEIRRIIYTTSVIENRNHQLRKVTRTKATFVSDDTLLKHLYSLTM